MALTESEELELLELENANALALQQKQAGPSRLDQGMRYAVASGVGNIAGMVNPLLPLATVPAARAIARNPRGSALAGADYLPAIGAIAAPLAVTLPTGGMAIPAGVAASGLGAAGGEGVRQIVRRGLNAEPAPPVSLPFIGNLPKLPGMNKEASNMVTQGLIGSASDAGGLAVAKIAGPVSSGLRNFGVGSARRHLGNLKSNLTSTKSATDALRKQAMANQAAEYFLEAGKISKLGSTQQTLNNALKMRSASVNGIDDVLKSADEAGGAINSAEFAVKLEKHLKPKYPDEKIAFNKILDDITAGDEGTGMLRLAEAKINIKPNLGKSYEAPLTGRAVSLNRRAAKFLENTIASNVTETLGEAATKIYKTNNAVLSKSTNALRSIAPQQALEMGNQIPSLTGSLYGASRLASGDVIGAGMAVGGSELLKRRGAGAIANAAYGASKAAKSLAKTPGVSSAILKAISSWKQKRQEK